MKRIFVVAVAAMLAVGMTGCVFSEVPQKEPQSQTRDVTDFDSVSLEGVGDLRLVQDEDYALKINASDDVLERLHIEVRGDTLHIDWDNRWFGWWIPWSEPELEILVMAPEFEKLDVSGAGNVTIDGLTGDAFEFELSGAGTLYGRDIEFDELSVRVSGAGAVDLSGQVDAQEIEISGAGSYEAGSLETRNTSVEMSGAGSAVVWAERVLDVEMSGAGSVEYYGDPKVSQNLSGIGSVNHRGQR